ncbi:Polyphosphate kinase 2 (PPK2) [Streptomyces lavendulae subsp. lavendulae]|uniref:Polyphosphate kinase 2 (PPK2) n=1 Tax=Streptomyces lavendulae subsp. lavendulae TaxID=58340 RepID=A0A2K8P8Z1_STRLA|nr:Polyphosphate kinase 2 (PPK2) [Streptomyces lavendulae subsp. lavendulae]
MADGILLVKFWLSVSRAEQRTRFAIRRVDPVRQWKLSPTDIASLGLWDAYTAAKVDMFRATDTEHAPWTVVKTNDKRRARLEALRSLPWRIDYDRKDTAAVGQPDPLSSGPRIPSWKQARNPPTSLPTRLPAPPWARACTLTAITRRGRHRPARIRPVARSALGEGVAYGCRA